MKRHQFDTLSFVAGILITLVGLLFLIPVATRDLVSLATRMAVWIWPVLFLVIGAAVLVPTLIRKDDGDQNHKT